VFTVYYLPTAAAAAAAGVAIYSASVSGGKSQGPQQSMQLGRRWTACLFTQPAPCLTHRHSCYQTSTARSSTTLHSL